MKKNKKTKTERKSAIKRGEKRAARLKKTQAEMPAKKARLIAERKYKEKKIQEAIMKLVETRKEQIGKV